MDTRPDFLRGRRINHAVDMDAAAENLALHYKAWVRSKEISESSFSGQLTALSSGIYADPMKHLTPLLTRRVRVLLGLRPEETKAAELSNEELVAEWKRMEAGTIDQGSNPAP